MAYEHEHERSDQPGRRLNAKVIGGIVIAVLAVIFIVQNTDEAQVDFLMFDFRTGIWLILLIAFVAGMLLAWLLTRFRRTDR